MRPDFYICGAPRSGTTSLHEYLSSHPSVVMTDPKETFFFHRYDDAKEFEELIRKKYLSHYQGEDIIGEGTTKTMYRTSALNMIQEVSPNAKLICLFRNPIERAWSHYTFRVQHGQRRPTVPFSEVIRNEEHDENKALEVGIVELGRYWKYVQRLEAQFPSENIHVTISSDLFGDPSDQMEDVFQFLGVDPSLDIATGEVHNESAYPGSPDLYQALYSTWKPIENALPNKLRGVLRGPVRRIRSVLLSRGSDKPEMNAADRRYLQDVYRDPNRRLGEWLGRDLSHWT